MKHPVKGYKIGDIENFPISRGVNRKYILGTDKQGKLKWIEYELVFTRIY